MIIPALLLIVVLVYQLYHTIRLSRELDFLHKKALEEFCEKSKEVRSGNY